MTKDNQRKAKLLVLMDLFRQHTDPDHPLTTQQICSMMLEKGVNCDRRTLRRDIEAMQEFGYDIQSIYLGHEKAYYINDAKFSLSELKFLVDAVQAAKFIPADETKRLSEKIAHLGGINTAEKLRKGMLYFNQKKRMNTEIDHNTEILATASYEHKQVSFYYFKTDEDHQRIFCHDKKRYIVDPITLIIQNDCYYLVVWDPFRKAPRIYRVDHMMSVQQLESSISDEAMNYAGNITQHVNQSFKMFMGPLTNIVLLIHESCIDNIYDQFGLNTPIVRVDSEHCRVTVNVQISPIFWGWLFQFEKKIKIISPAYLVDEYKNLLLYALDQLGH